MGLSFTVRGEGLEMSAADRERGPKVVYVKDRSHSRWQKFAIAVTSLAFSACLNLTYPSNFGDSGGTGGARFDASPTDGTSQSSDGIGSGGSGENSGGDGGLANDASGSGGNRETSTGGSGGILGSGGGEGGSDASPDAPTVEADPGMGGTDGSKDGATSGETAIGGTTGTRDAPPEVATEMPIDTALDAASTLPTGLIAYYPCEKADGTNLTDMSGNGNHGALHAATGSGGSSGSGYAFGGGKVGNALTLSQAGSGYVSLPAWIFSTTTDITIATWVKLNTLTVWQRLFDTGTNANLNQNTATGTSYATLFLKDLNNKFGLSSTQNGYGSAEQITADALPTGVWKHVTVVFSGGSAALYVDGTVVSMAGSFPPPQALGLNYAFIGKSQFGVDPFIDAQIDEFRVYNRALSASEIQTVFRYAGP
jgi:hypothetical protein